MTGRTLPWIVCSLAALGLSVLWFGRTPLFGDEIGYSYTAAGWIAEHSMTPVPAGEGRGEQGMGHPALFFWLWAALMRLFGDTLATARILPTIAAAFALAGTWRLGREMGGSGETGAMAALGLLASPLFLAQAFRAMPESAHMAAVAWAFVFFIGKRRISAVLAVSAAVVFRYQGIFLVPAFLAADLLQTRRFSPKLLIWLAPGLVPLITGLLNHLVNGYFFFPTYLGASSPELQPDWLPCRIRLFAGHLLGEDFRWFPVSVALAAVFSKTLKKPAPWMVAALSLPALLYPASRLSAIAGFSILCCVPMLQRRSVPSPGTAAALAFIAINTAFHVLIVAFAPDPGLNLFRYIIGSYPPLMALLAAGTALAGKSVSRPVWAVFLIASLSCIGAVRYPWQPDASVAGLLEARAVRRAVAAVQNPVLPDRRQMMLPALGYVNSPKPFTPGDTIHLVVTTADRFQSHRLFPEGYVPTGRLGFLWKHRGLTVEALEAVRE